MLLWIVRIDSDQKGAYKLGRFMTRSAESAHRHRMQTIFSTGKVHPRDRLTYWRDEASKSYVEHDFSSSV
jgi:hypothetical protein